MESHYSLNVAIHTRQTVWPSTPERPVYRCDHYCKIMMGPDRDRATRVASELTKRFPQGTRPGEFKLSLTYWECHETPVQIEESI